VGVEVRCNEILAAMIWMQGSKGRARRSKGSEERECEREGGSEQMKQAKTGVREGREEREHEREEGRECGKGARKE
jgi:hypothetical protein